MKSRIVLFISFFFFVHQSLFAAPKFFISFTDKNNSPYSISNPSAYLSAKAITRRANQQIAIQINDLPVNPNYINQVLSQGATLHNKSKWLNGITIECDSSVLSAIQAFSFVSNAVRVRRQIEPAQGFGKFEHVQLLRQRVDLNVSQSLNYGAAFNQIHLMNGDYLHDNGFTGSDMVIAILDDGFYQADQVPAFNSLYSRSGVLGTWDFVDHHSNVYDDDMHGQEVLSCIAANIPGQIIGTAPGANFWLLRSEDVFNENLIEEYNWISAAEFADSAGADIISSSLGYSTFADTSTSHTYAEMDGNTCPGSIGADIAASKGLLVIVSAGNDGFNTWHYITTPADGDSVLTIGAVDSLGHKANFSSWGPSADGDVKPNVAAQGKSVTIAFFDGTIGPGSGTSFSCPILAGAAACLWQAHPDKSNMEIFHAIERSANYFATPGDSLGYGIPDFMVADLVLGGIISGVFNDDHLVSIYPNPFQSEVQLDFYSTKEQDIKIEISSITGQKIIEQDVRVYGNKVNRIDSNSLITLPAGIYLVQIRTKEKSFVSKIIKI